VSLSIHKRTGQPRAIKKIDREETNSEEFEDELQALICLDHPHIVKVLEYFEDPTHFHVVMELCNGKNLVEHINSLIGTASASSTIEREASIIIRQCLKAVIGCHSKGFIHRDLKPENFLLTDKDLTVKLIDFGLATRCSDGKRTQGIAGTGAFIAPEMFHGSQYDKAVDIWSIGVILFMMLTQEKLLPDGKEETLLQDDAYVKQRISESEELTACSEDAKDLVKQMLEWDPEKRITASGILEHPFITARGCQSLCDPTAQKTSLFEWEFDKQLPLKMERYAKCPLLRQLALRCLVHLAAAATLPDKLSHDLIVAKHHFRSLNPTGSGQLSEHELRVRLKREGVSIPINFSETFRKCHRGNCNQEAVLEFDVLVACILIDAVWPDALMREAFSILDRSRDGVIEAEDLVMLVNSHDQKNDLQEMIREVDTEDSGYINYEKFMRLMEIAHPLFQWFATPIHE